jgi:hypothetical protein
MFTVEVRRSGGCPPARLSSLLYLAPVLVLLLSVLLLGCTSTSHRPDLSAYPWLYLGYSRPLGRHEEPVAVTAVGDVMLGSDVTREMNFACGSQACRVITPEERLVEEIDSGMFLGGRIDLTGDGHAEHVRREEQQVVIYTDGTEVWRSPDTWRVVDAALGDPNADGRGEILLALWKRGLDGLEEPSLEKEGEERSRPFIIGYRGGIYRTLWGGSAVSRPIHEVELGDLDDDGLEDLVVLEGDDPEERTVAFWRWHGWGFSLIWRSEPNVYRDLVLTEDGIIRVALK